MRRSRRASSALIPAMQSPARRSLQQTLLSTTQEAAEPPEPAGASPAPASPTREEPAAAKGALGLFCGGWTSLCHLEASIPQRLLALVERVRSPLAAPHDLLGLRWLWTAAAGLGVRRGAKLLLTRRRRDGLHREWYAPAQPPPSRPTVPLRFSAVRAEVCLCATFEPAGRQAPLLIIAVVLCLLALAAPTCARAWQRMAEPTLADRE